jgi:hypothetical protein
LYEKHNALREYLVGLNSKCESSLKSESIATDDSLKDVIEAIKSDSRKQVKKNQSNNTDKKCLQRIKDCAKCAFVLRLLQSAAETFALLCFIAAVLPSHLF